MEQPQVHCPKCNSTQITAQKHGFSAGKAVAGAVLTGGVGVLAGLHGSNNIDITCLNCGHKWNPKELSEQNKRASLQKEFADLKVWKRGIYDAYNNKDFKKAEEIYLSKYAYSARMKDIHGVYKFYKKADAQVTIFLVGILVVIISIVVLILK